MQDPKPGAAPPRLLSPGVNAGALRRILVIENMKALDFVERLTPDVMERIETILANKPEPFSDYR
jgi:hypothetical protein